MKQKIAIAAFVKTPELSPVKTRLAKTIGKRQAIAIYEESVKQTAITLQAAVTSLESLHAYWAVAEQQATNHQRWQQFSTLWTGDNSLAHRLHHVYSTLRQHHDRVILIGTDCPQLPQQYILEAAQTKKETIIGKATDGGFYLFSSNQTIAAECWLNVRYSEENTLTQLINTLTTAGVIGESVEYLPTLSDIDDRESLEECIEQWGENVQKDGIVALMRDLGFWRGF